MTSSDSSPPPPGDSDVPADDPVEWNAPMSVDEIHAMGYTHKDATGRWIKPPLEREPFDAGPDLAHVAERGNGERARISEHFVGLTPELKARIREQLGEDAHTTTGRDYVDGGAFIYDAPAQPPAVWGDEDSILWSEGEPFLGVGPQGVGKTTLAVQLAFARVGLLPDVLGLPVVDTGGRVLFIAADRAAQIRRVFRRLADHLGVDRAVLEERIVFWPGPPPRDLAQHPDTLTEMCLDNDGVDWVWFDALKDVALRLTDDEVGSGINRAMQTAIAEGIQVGGNHHQRKGRDGRRPNTLEDVYGSTWITAGCGSVVLLWGAAGDPIVELTHLKQPAAEVGPWTIAHDHLTGLSTVHRGQVDPYTFLKARPNGGTAPELARLMFGRETPTDAEVRKARYQLEKLVDKQLAHRKDPIKGGPDGTQPARYHAITRAEEPPAEEET